MSTDTTSQPAPSIPPMPLTQADVPDHKFQINHDLLYEREFERGAFVSAHLQRLQNGCFTDKNIHSKDTIHVTFAAITFTFHPVTSSGSADFRFESAVIEISAKSCGQPLKVLKYAPHMAFGRISSASLKWHFRLGASVGVTNGPAKAEITPAADYEKDVVVGTMMKIQGSTRSSPSPLTNTTGPPRLQDTKVVWTLEENTQQNAGIPREFTFVFLMERPQPTTKQQVKEKRPAVPKRQSTVTSSPLDNKRAQRNSIAVEQSLEIQISGAPRDLTQHELAPSTTPGHGMIDNLMAQAAKITEALHSKESIPTYEESTSVSLTKVMDADYHDIFREIQFSIFVKPEIAGMNIPKSLFDHGPQLSIVRGEVGQKLSTMVEGDVKEGEVVEGLYNFARLPCSFEELIELPGNTTTTVEPTVNSPGK